MVRWEIQSLVMALSSPGNIPSATALGFDIENAGGIGFRYETYNANTWVMGRYSITNIPTANSKGICFCEGRQVYNRFQPGRQ